MATLLETDIAHLSENIAQQYAIPAQYFEDQSIKRGLRNADGTGVLAGVTRICNVHGYVMEAHERRPAEGRLFYPRHRYPRPHRRLYRGGPLRL